MSEEFVTRNEFNQLKSEVNEIKQEVAESSKILVSIERKLDIIDQKISSTEEINILKLSPIENRVTKLENGISWLWKLCAGAIITGVISAIITFK